MHIDTLIGKKSNALESTAEMEGGHGWSHNLSYIGKDTQEDVAVVEEVSHGGHLGKKEKDRETGDCASRVVGTLTKERSRPQEELEETRGSGREYSMPAHRVHLKTHVALLTLEHV